MSLIINKSEKVNDYKGAVVYLKNTQLPKITVQGKVVSVETDNYTIKIQTETELAVFDTQDVAAVTFLK